MRVDSYRIFTRVLGSRWPAVCVAVIVVCLSVASGIAAERPREFVDGLRERRHFDTAIEYLESARNKADIDKEFKDEIDYQIGVILVEMSRVGLSKAAREKTLADAWVKLDKFLKEHPKHAKADQARTQIANLLVERGRLKIDLADGPGTAQEKREKLQSDARELYGQAKEIFEELELKCIKAHRKIPKLIPNKNQAQIAARDDVRRNILQNRLLIAATTAELARTYPPDSEDFKREMNAAAAKYKELYDKYGTIGILAGYYGRLWEAKCYKDLKQPQKAWDALADTDELGYGPPAFRKLKSKWSALAMEVGIDSKLKKYKECIGFYDEWDRFGAGDRKTPEALAIQFFAGEAKFLLATDDDEKLTDLDKAKLLLQAKNHFRYVAREPGDHQKAAQKALLREELGGSGSEGIDADDTPATFVDAFNAAKDELTGLQDPKLDAAKKAEIQQKAIELFRLALTLKTNRTTVNELNVVRYYLTYMYYTAGDLHRAAAMGEFLAINYPQGVGAKQGAKIAMACYLNLYNEAAKNKDETGKANTKFESRNLERMARYIASRWQGEPMADDAWMMLVRNAEEEGDLAKARSYRNKISKDSPLSKIGDRDQGNTFASLNRVAETFVHRAEAMDSGKGELSADAKEYYEKAAGAYAKILELCEADPDFAPSETAPDSIKIRQARCLRRMGKYLAAHRLLVDVLKNNQDMIDAQVEAAYNYQAWGREHKDYYILAIKGGTKSIKNGQIFYLVWGWGKIAAKLIKSPQHQDTFYEARYNLALCRFLRAMQLAGEERAVTLKRAEKDIRVVQLFRPELGGPQWSPKFGQLLRKIYVLQGQDPEEQLALKAIEKMVEKEEVAEPEEETKPAVARTAAGSVRSRRFERPVQRWSQQRRVSRARRRNRRR